MSEVQASTPLIKPVVIFAMAILEVLIGAINSSSKVLVYILEIVIDGPEPLNADVIAVRERIPGRTKFRYEPSDV